MFMKYIYDREKKLKKKKNTFNTAIKNTKKKCRSK